MYAISRERMFCPMRSDIAKKLTVSLPYTVASNASIRTQSWAFSRTIWFSADLHCHWKDSIEKKTLINKTMPNYDQWIQTLKISNKMIYKHQPFSCRSGVEWTFLFLIFWSNEKPIVGLHKKPCQSTHPSIQLTPLKTLPVDLFLSFPNYTLLSGQNMRAPPSFVKLSDT